MAVVSATLLLATGCGRSPEPAAAPPSAAATLTARTAADGAPPREPTLAEKSAQYTKEHPWGDFTGTSRLHGKLHWPAPPAAVVRRALVLKGIKGTPSAGLYYRVRTDGAGEFVFDRVKGGEFKLSDDISDGFHWRLRVEIRDGEERAIDLTPSNSRSTRDDFPLDGN